MKNNLEILSLNVSKVFSLIISELIVNLNSGIGSDDLSNLISIKALLSNNLIHSSNFNKLDLIKLSPLNLFVLIDITELIIRTGFGNRSNNLFKKFGIVLQYFQLFASECSLFTLV